MLPPSPTAYIESCHLLKPECPVCYGIPVITNGLHVIRSYSSSPQECTLLNTLAPRSCYCHPLQGTKRVCVRQWQSRHYYHYYLTSFSTLELLSLSSWRKAELGKGTDPLPGSAPLPCPSQNSVQRTMQEVINTKRQYKLWLEYSETGLQNQLSTHYETLNKDHNLLSPVITLQG